MPATDPRVDAYIDKQAAFAQPILRHLRAVVHAACPDAAEAMKWGMPFITYNSKNLCNMAGFKAHVAFGFWHDGVAKEVLADSGSEAAMGQFGRITALSDLPDDAVIAALVAKAMALIDAGKKPRQNAKPRAPLEIVAEFQSAIDANAEAANVWAGFAPGKVRDYAEWISEAKRPETRAKRIAQAVEWIAEGKERHWKYKSG